MPEPAKRRSAFFLIRPRTAMLRKASAANFCEVACAVATGEPCLAECVAEPRLALDARRNRCDESAAHCRLMNPVSQGRHDSSVPGYDKFAQT